MNDGGWTLAETVVVIAIILILTGTAGLVSLRYLNQARQAAARLEMETISLALDAYYLDCGVYPTREQGLAALIRKPWLEPLPENWRGPYLSGDGPVDPWGNPYVYTVPGKNGFPYTLRTLGADGIPGGEGRGKDGGRQ
ncbi:MAG: type II secretion system major pseudopilin GspG [Spirochaetia bacterium]